MFSKQKLLAFAIIIVFALYFILTQSVQASSVFVFNKNLRTGNTNADVKELQRFLNNNGFVLNKSGFGSLGRETNFFGSATRNALIKFQKANKITPAAGYFGPITRNAVNKIIKLSTTGSNSSGNQVNDNQPVSQINNQSNHNLKSGYYTIGGSITGISGPVILKNNNDFIIIKPGNIANFTFPTRLSSGSNYSITATSDHLNQKCYLKNNIGTINNADVDNIRAACGANLYYNPFTFISGGGSGEPAAPTVVAPSALSYISPNLFVVDTAISTLSPTVSGSVDSYSVSPDLPAGLLLDTSTGQITGTPTASTTQTTYTITATNTGGSTTFEIVIMVDGTVVGANGKIWLDRNLGATLVALSSTDSNAYGNLFQWGRLADGHQVRTSDTSSTNSSTDDPEHSNFILEPDSLYDWRIPQNDNLWQGVSGINDPCPTGFRLPTEVEWEAERTSWSSDDSSGAFESSLKLTLAGYRLYNNGSLENVDSYGLYWSSVIGGTQSRSLVFTSSAANMSTNYRAYGFSVRCTADSYAVAYDDNGSTGGTAPSSQTKTHDVALVLATNSGTLVKTGYTFSGWNTSADGAGTDYAEGADYTASASITFYAKWTINTYTVTFNTNSGDGGSTATQTLSYNTPTVLTTNGFTKTGYTFAGWATTTDGAVAYANGASYTIGTENITLYAKWNLALVVGGSYQGGKIAYIYQAGDPPYVEGETHGLIAATVDQSTGIIWAKLAYQSTAVGGTGTALGSGLANTNSIIAQNVVADDSYAASIARSYDGGGYDDWYLPSQDELNKLYINRAVIGGLSSFYWSSSEYNATLSSMQWLGVGSWFQESKSHTWYVRAVRSF